MKQPIQRVAFSAASAGAFAFALVSLSACGSGSSAPSPTPTAVPTVAPSPTPAPVVGKITFGKSVTGVTLHGESASFKSPPSVAWVAQFNPKPAGSAAKWTMTRIGGVGPHPSVVWTQAVSLRSGGSAATSTVTKAQLQAHGIGANQTFTVSYVQAGKTLATGNFALTSSSGGGVGGY